MNEIVLKSFKPYGGADRTDIEIVLLDYNHKPRQFWIHYNIEFSKCTGLKHADAVGPFKKYQTAMKMLKRHRPECVEVLSIEEVKK